MLLPDSEMHSIKLINQTQLSERFLLGCSENPTLHLLIFALFLSMYLATVNGNLLIILGILSDPHIYRPIYFFRAKLSLVDVCFTSTTVPKILVNIQMQNRSIRYADCITEMSFLIIFAGLDDFLLAMMAYDQFMAICHLLHCTVSMTPWLCEQLVLLCLVIGVLHALLNSLLVLRLNFCTHLEIRHFSCELNQVVHRACSDTFLNDLMFGFEAVLLAGGPLSMNLYYSKITSSIHAISSAQGKYKTFSTCASHLLTISLFYGTSLGAYLSASAALSSASTAIASVMYTMVTPMLNPFIYSLRNIDMKRALKRLLFHK
ncbi:olfactory receptor 7A10-like [Ochotona curzoniae]|uniref:olfactory receptor 7A10-like n=1 Tax=Ochotona curzoniae TaxID=130825 RepID=UPI001B34D9AE|nr:olfactory receptor 7A10-like [Ochotona curzoniae]